MACATSLPQCREFARIRETKVTTTASFAERSGDLLCTDYYSVSRQGRYVNQKVGILRSVCGIGTGDSFVVWPVGKQADSYPLGFRRASFRPTNGRGVLAKE